MRLMRRMEQRFNNFIDGLLYRIIFSCCAMSLIGRLEYDERWSSLPWKVRGRIYVDAFMDLVRVVFLGKEPRFLEEGRRASLIDE